MKLLSLAKRGKSSGEPESGIGRHRLNFHPDGNLGLAVSAFTEVTSRGGEHRTGTQTVAELTRWLELNPPQSIRDDTRLWYRQGKPGSMQILTSPWTGDQIFEWSGPIFIAGEPGPATATLSMPLDLTEIPALVYEP